MRLAVTGLLAKDHFPITPRHPGSIASRRWLAHGASSHLSASRRLPNADGAATSVQDGGRHGTAFPGVRPRHLQDFSVIYDVNMRRQKTALSYWFPKIEPTGIPVPRPRSSPCRRQRRAAQGQERKTVGRFVRFGRLSR